MLSGNNKILFIGPLLFGYYKDIISEFNQNGYEVDFFPERNEYLNSLVNYFKKGNNNRCNLNKLYENKILKKIKGKTYDYFILIRGEIISREFINCIKKDFMNNCAQTVYYSWDSSTNLPNSLAIRNLFDRSFTFDLKDSINYKDWLFLPLFYNKVYGKDYLSSNYNGEIDIGIVASFTVQRHEMVNKLRNYGFNVSDYLYKSKFQTGKEFLLNRDFRKHYYNIKTKPFSQVQIIDLYHKSKCVLDIPSATQSGLSMRTIECLGMKKKMITTNADVIKYDFYNSNNIMIIDNDFDFSRLKIWMNKPYIELDSSIYKEYSIENWVNTILSTNEKI